jgi:hypothetical protein
MSRYELESFNERDLAHMGMIVWMRSTRFRSHSGRNNIGLMGSFEAEELVEGPSKNASPNTAK